MFRFLFELFVGPAVELKDKTIATGSYFGLVIVMGLIYMVFPLGPFVLWGVFHSPSAIAVVGGFGVVAFGMGAGSVDIWLDKLQKQVRNELLRGKPLDERIEGE